MYGGLNPLDLLNYPAEDVFTLISDTIDYNSRHKQREVKSGSNGKVIRKPAGDDWF